MRLISYSLLMCPAEDWRAQARWNGSTTESRRHLLQELTSKELNVRVLAFTDLVESISPSVMIPDHRLAHLLNHVKQSQINNCLYHNTATPPSLYADHMCERDDFPLRTVLELDGHSDEVWYLEFSHDGTRLATASKDHTVLIYETATFTILHRLTDHEREVTYVSWSPDDSKLISCSMDHKARVWDVSVSNLLSQYMKVDVDAYTNSDWPLFMGGRSPHARVRCLVGPRWPFIRNFCTRESFVDMSLECEAFRLW